MSDFEDELESIEEYADAEYDDNDDSADGWNQSMDDLESDQWSKKFGDSYVEDYYDASELDDSELERLEDEFFNEAEDDEISPFGQLDELEPDE